MKGLRGRAVNHNPNLHPAFGSKMVGLKRSNSLTLWPHALMLMAHGAHPDDAAQQAVHHQIQQDDLQQTQLAIEETLAAQIRQAKQEALELELQDKIRDTNKKLVTDALDQGLEPNRARTLGGGVAMSPAKKRRGEQLQDASGAMVTSNGRGGTYQIGGAGSSGNSAPTAEGTAPLPDATPATAPGAAPDAVRAEPTNHLLPPPPDSCPEPYYEDLEAGPGRWTPQCPLCGSAVRWEMFGGQRKVFCRCAAYPDCKWNHYSRGNFPKPGAGCRKGDAPDKRFGGGGAAA